MHSTTLLCPILVFAIACSSPSAESVGTAADPEPTVKTNSVEIVRGVPDRGRTPAVVAIDVGGQGLCSGTLIAKNAVLTARHCVSHTSESVSCPSSSPQVTDNRSAESLSIYSGETIDAAIYIGKGKQVFVPTSNSLCGADIAIIVLDQVEDDVAPLAIRARGPALSETVRAVGYGKATDDGGAGAKLLRDHVKIESVTKTEFLVGEATCQGDSGGPALDEKTGEIVGVISRGGPSCEGKDVHNIYTRVDGFSTLIHDALDYAADLAAKATKAEEPKATAKKTPPKASKPTTDMGETCSQGTDCAAGICVEVGSDAYCSRSCGTGDRCPTHFHCTKSEGSRSVCVRSQ